MYDTPDTRAKGYEHMLKKGGLKMNAENALKQLGKVKYVVVTNPKGQIMDVLGINQLNIFLFHPSIDWIDHGSWHR